MKRLYVSEDDLQTGIRILEQSLNKRIGEKGSGAFVGKHEILGIITEEYHELVEVIKNDTNQEEFSNELMDIIIAAIWGYISLTKIKDSNEK